MESSGQVNNVEEIVSSDSVKVGEMFSETYITDSVGASTKVKTTLPENEAMDTDAPCENENLVAESISKSNFLTITEENNRVTVNTCNSLDNTNCSNIHSESSNNESSAKFVDVFKAEDVLETTPDEELKIKQKDIGTANKVNQQNKSESCMSTQNEEEIVGLKEKNSCNIIEENKTEAMITDVTLENSEVVNEQKESYPNTMLNVVEGNRDPVIADAMKKYLDTAHQNSKTAYQKDVNGLKLLCDYGSDSDDNEGECKVDLMITSDKSSVSNVQVVDPCPAVSQEYRKPEVVAPSESEEETDSSDEEDDSSSSSSTATSSSSSDESDDSVNSSENECVVIEEKKPSAELPKTKGELGLKDLPLIEDLHISVPESECVEIGQVLSIVDSLVVVQSIKGCPPLDLESILFLDNGHKTLGEVFDVFGKVGEACYCVRFNSKDHVLSKGIEIGMPVYYAPRTEHSKFVFLADLVKMKGSDASWEHNNEPPPKFLDFSDDEEERKARKKGKKPQTRDVEPDDTQPQNKRFSRRGGRRGGFGCAPPERDSSRPSWSTPFNRYPCSSPSPCQPGPQPLIRPPSFRTTGPPQSHYHNAAAGAPAMPPTPSPWAVPPPTIAKDFNYNLANIPPPQSHFGQNHTRPGGSNMNMGGFGQPPPPPPPPSPASRNYMTPTSIPGAGPFAIDSRRFPRPETLNTVTSNPPNDFSFFRQGPGAQRPFRSQDPVFMNRNVPPPRPPQGL